MRNSNNGQQSWNQNSQLRSVQAQIEGPVVEQDRKETLEPNARIYAFTRGDAEVGSSKVVSG